jgi:hypothetical protein
MAVARLTAAVADRYRIEHELGPGGYDWPAAGAPQRFPPAKRIVWRRGPPTGSRVRRLGRDPSTSVRRAGGVIAVDTNLLVYAHREDSPWHGAARALVGVAEGVAP